MSEFGMARPPTQPVVEKLVHELADTCARADCFNHLGPTPVPSPQAVVRVIRLSRHLIFPGYFTSQRLCPAVLEDYLLREARGLHEALRVQAVAAIRRHCERDLKGQACAMCRERGEAAAAGYLAALPEMRVRLAADVRAALEGDPAARSHDEIIFSYPGFFAVTVYRLAHVLHEAGVPLLPRMMTEYAHARTGIDIHPGATIGESFFIDHGTGVVIGETTVIGRNVRIYQGVTLGALSIPRGASEELRRSKRHPTIEDEAIIYSGATILGGQTVIGARSIIGGNVWLTASVPPDSRVYIKTPELVFRNGHPDGPRRSE